MDSTGKKREIQTIFHALLKFMYFQACAKALCDRVLKKKYRIIKQPKFNKT